MAVASSRVTSIAIRQEVDPEELGGWKLHTGTTGLVDVAVDTDEEALEHIRRFLSYLPSHNGEPAPLAPVPEGSDGRCEKILDLLPESRTQVYDSRAIVESIVDADSMYELKSRFGKSILTCLARIDGKSIGVIASNPKFRGGAIDVDAVRKVTSFLVLCDSYNLPIVFLVDQPGFLIGVDGERRAAPGLIMNWMNALSQVTVPKISITMRKNYGQAFLNMGGGRNSDENACWPTADFGFMDPHTSVNVLHGIQREDDPERFDELVKEVSQESEAWPLASLFEVQTVLDPRETRNFLIDMLGIHARLPNGGVGRHLLANWPTTF